MTQELVITVLKTIYHPDKSKNLVELEMIQDLKVEADKISFKLALKAANDPFKNSLKSACEEALKNEFGKQVSIDIEIALPERKPKKVEEPVLGKVKNIIAVASGKGGVGKSTVSVNLAVTMAKKGYKVGIIDADIFGPSIPKMLGTEDARPYGHNVDGKDMILPVNKYDVKMLSIGFFVDPNEAIVWRGPMASTALKQLMTDALWDGLDYLFIDLPPGTSDIHLTLVQTVSVTGAVVVSTPQDVALADAIKGIQMFQGDQIKVPILGLVENMAWFTPEELPDHKYYIFGKEGCKDLAEQMKVPFLGQVPIVQGIREGGDQGKPASLSNNMVGQSFESIADEMVKQVEDRNKKIKKTPIVELKKK